MQQPTFFDTGHMEKENAVPGLLQSAFINRLTVVVAIEIDEILSIFLSAR